MFKCSHSVITHFNAQCHFVFLPDQYQKQYHTSNYCNNFKSLALALLQTTFTHKHTHAYIKAHVKPPPPTKPSLTHTHRPVLISLEVHSPAVLLCFYMKAWSRTLIHDWIWMSLFITEAWGTRVPTTQPPTKPHQTAGLKLTPPLVITPTISQRGKATTPVMLFLK